MISRVVYRKQRGRRWLAALAAASLVGGVFLVSSTVLAVHATGAFQLDGDAQQGTSPTTSTKGTLTPNGDDWDNICKSNPTTCTFQTGLGTGVSASTTATASAHDSDGAANASIFTGGGSKDPQDLSSWNWKTDTGGLPAKDNLAHSFAARYSLNSTGTGDPTCPSSGSGGTGACKLLYFGSDRIDNSGDAQEGFWFFQNPVCLKADGTFGNTISGTPPNTTCTGTAAHKVGDLLVLSDFSVGGTTSTINIYKWVASGGDVATNLLSLGGSTSANCQATTPPLNNNDAFCGLVNAANGTIAPWTFTDKSGNSTYLAGELYEGGVNLSDPSVNLGGECFASFLSETRSSTSPSATLKDFVLGSFASCTSGTKTTPLDSNGNPITSPLSLNSGSFSVTDQAVVTVSGAATFGGSVTFHLCGPADLVSQTTCDTGGTLIGSSKAVSPPSPATVTSDAATITSAGNYCWRADYSGDAANLVPPSSDHSATECFTVVQSSISTAPSSATIVLASSITDGATVTGQGGGTPTGKVQFFVCTPAQLTPANTGLCTSGGTQLIATGSDATGEPLTAATATTATATSASYTPTVVGKFCFRGVYAPATGSPYEGATDSTSSECFTVTDTSSVLTDQTWVPNDHAQVTSTGGSALDGSVVFTLYNNGTCNAGTNNANVLYTSGSIAVSGASPQVADSANTTHVNASTTVSWKVVYTSNNSTSGSTSSCESTALTINNNPGYAPLP